jgi:hypothetical protein
MAKRPDRLGVLMTPRAGNRVEWAVARGTIWAGDNDCFQGLHAPRWLRFLAKCAEAPEPPVWVACPDAVGDALATWHQYVAWSPAMRALGLPVALVLQDGCELYFRPGCPLARCWDEIAAVFVGGSTEWKLSDAAIEVCREAKARGKWVHVGRCNTLRRITYFARRARDAGFTIDSFDGTGFSRFGDKRIPHAVRWIDRAMADRQTVLWGGVA